MIGFILNDKPFGVCWTREILDLAVQQGRNNDNSRAVSNEKLMVKA